MAKERSDTGSIGGGFRSFLGSMPWSAIIQMINQEGEASRGRRETYDPSTGQFYDSNRVETGYGLGATFAPHKALSDPDVAPIDKWMTGILGLGALSYFTGGGKRYRERKEARLKEQTEKAHEIFRNAPKYEIPQEALDILEMSAEGAEKSRGYTEKALGLAKKSTEEDMPGMGIMKENIISSGANVASNISRSGNINDLTEIHRATTRSLQNLHSQNAAYKDRTSKDLQSTMMGAAQNEVAAANLQIKGLSSMVDQKEQAFQINYLDPRYNELQYDLIQLGNQMALSNSSGGFLSGMFN